MPFTGEGNGLLRPMEKDASNRCHPWNITRNTNTRNTNASLLALYLPKTIEKDVFE
jgi:hypothetical protein